MCNELISMTSVHLANVLYALTHTGMRLQPIFQHATHYARVATQLVGFYLAEYRYEKGIYYKRRDISTPSWASSARAPASIYQEQPTD